MTRGRLVVGNWKLNPATVADATALARTVAAIPHPGTTVGVAPPAIALTAVAGALRGSDVAVYAQDVHWEDTGAYTGQLSVAMLRGVAAGSIVGHSEVRRDQCDDDARVARKLARVLSAGLHAILCVGETEAQFAAEETEAVLTRQIDRDLMDVRGVTADRFVVAYEPIWAIGTGRPATGAHASAAARTIRTALRVHGLPADAIRVLYGGSVSSASVAEFAAAAGIAGALVGGASLKADEFAAIIKAFGG
ncbi:MAG TPA: triose-phosphate isomerase [Candidatus Limnocylindria bacterium]|nr:triose-phosphate isomerase [Candidatus Limnocylindria bacterium]